MVWRGLCGRGGCCDRPLPTAVLWSASSSPTREPASDTRDRAARDRGAQAPLQWLLLTCLACFEAIATAAIERPKRIAPWR